MVGRRGWSARPGMGVLPGAGDGHEARLGESDAPGEDPAAVRPEQANGNQPAQVDRGGAVARPGVVA